MCRSSGEFERARGDRRISSGIVVAPLTPCPSCGAPLGGREGCQSAFDVLSARAWENPVRASLHNMVVDTYALQHPDDYCKSAKSYAAHLAGLCCGLERPDDRTLYWRIPRWLDGPARIDKPSVITDRGHQTIADISMAPDDRYQSAVTDWANNVWNAYASQQALARKWVTLIEATTRTV
jgi:hypothetical protein